MSVPDNKCDDYESLSVMPLSIICFLVRNAIPDYLESIPIPATLKELSELSGYLLF